MNPLAPLRPISRTVQRVFRRLFSSAPTSKTPESDVAWQERQFKTYATPQPWTGPLNIQHGNLTGETWEMRRAYREWSVKEPAVKGALLTKCLAVCQLDLQVLPCDKRNANDRAAAEWVKYAIQSSDEGVPGLIFNLLFPGLIDGFSVVEKVFRHVEQRDSRYAGWWTLASAASIDTEYIRFRLDQYRQVVGVHSVAGTQTAVEMSPADYVIFTHLKLFENPFGVSDLRAIVRAARLIESAIRLRHILITNYSGPFLRAQGGDPAARQQLVEVLENARANGWIILPDGFTLDVINLATANLEVFRATIEDYRQEIVTGIQGAYLQLLEGGVPGGRGDTQVHKGVSELFQWWLATWVCQVLNRQLVPDLVEPNYGQRVGMPRCILGGIDDQAVTSALARFKAGQDLGLTLSISQVSEVGGFESPDTPADALKPPAQNQQLPGGPSQPGQPDPFAGAFAHVGSGQPAVSRFADGPFLAWDDATQMFAEWHPYTSQATGKSGWISTGGQVRYDDPRKKDEEKSKARAGAAEAVSRAITTPDRIDDADVANLTAHFKTLDRKTLLGIARGLASKFDKTKQQAGDRIVAYVRGQMAGLSPDRFPKPPPPPPPPPPVAPPPPPTPAPPPPPAAPQGPRVGTTNNRTTMVRTGADVVPVTGRSVTFPEVPGREFVAARRPNGTGFAVYDPRSGLMASMGPTIPAAVRQAQANIRQQPDALANAPALPHPHPQTAQPVGRQSARPRGQTPPPAPPAPAAWRRDPSLMPTVKDKDGSERPASTAVEKTNYTAAELAAAGGLGDVKDVGRFTARLDGTEHSLKQMFGDKIPAGEAGKKLLSTAANASAGCRVTIDSRRGYSGDMVSMSTAGTGYTAERYIARDTDGSLYCKNSSFFMEFEQNRTPPPPWERVNKEMNGRDLLANQVRSLVALGVKKIKTHAARSDVRPGDNPGRGMNGYYTWPRLGYDATMEDRHWDKLPAALKRQVEANPVGSKFPRSVLALYASEAGRAWWKVHGSDLHKAEFDLTPGSLSHRTLKHYLDTKKDGE